MKRGLFAIVTLLMVSLSMSSCGEDCTAETLEETIIGTWEIKALGMTSGEIEFLADGTLIDPDDALIGGEINGTILDEKTYEVKSNSSFTAKAANGSLFLDFEFPVSSFDCDAIQSEVFGIPFSFERK